MIDLSRKAVLSTTHLLPSRASLLIFEVCVYLFYDDLIVPVLP